MHVYIHMCEYIYSIYFKKLYFFEFRPRLVLSRCGEYSAHSNNIYSVICKCEILVWWTRSPKRRSWGLKFDRVDTSWSFNVRCAKRVVLIPITDFAQKQLLSRADNRSGIYTLRACDTSRCVRLLMGYIYL